MALPAANKPAIAAPLTCRTGPRCPCVGHPWCPLHRSTPTPRSTGRCRWDPVSCPMWSLPCRRPSTRRKRLSRGRSRDRTRGRRCRSTPRACVPGRRRRCRSWWKVLRGRPMARTNPRQARRAPHTEEAVAFEMKRVEHDLRRVVRVPVAWVEVLERACHTPSVRPSPPDEQWRRIQNSGSPGSSPSRTRPAASRNCVDWLACCSAAMPSRK
ncbi:MAG: hypothetical protein QOG79_6885 [Mycobacterium sp.]|nr:hypothetical protein [Mycobacterium sp.]